MVDNKISRKLSQEAQSKELNEALIAKFLQQNLKSNSNLTLTEEVGPLKQVRKYSTPIVFQSNVSNSSLTIIPRSTRLPKPPSTTPGSGSSNTGTTTGTNTGTTTGSTTTGSQSSGPISTSGLRNLEMIKRYDRNNNLLIEDNEAAYHLLIGRQLNTERIYKDLLTANANTDKLQKIILAVDTQRNGVIDDSELVNALLKFKNGSLQVDSNLLDIVLANNPNKDQATRLIEALDSDQSGKIGNIEVLDALLASRQGLLDIQNPLLRTILATNPKFNNLSALLPSYDSSFNGNISDKEAYDILLAIRKGSIPGDLANKVLHLGNNQNAREIETSIEIFDPNADGTITATEFVNGVINVRKNQTFKLNPESSTDGIPAISYNHARFFNIIQEIPDLKNLFTAIDFIDKDRNGVFSDQEVVEMSFAVAKGLVQFSQATLDTVLASSTRSRDIRALFDRVDSDDNGTISNQEVFDSFTAMKKGQINRNLADVLSMILAENMDSQKIVDAVQAVDTDNNGVISGSESVIAQLKMRRGNLPNLQQTALDTVFQTSPDKIKVDQVLNYLDPDRNGTAEDIDLFTKALQFEAGTSGIDKTQNREIFTKALIELDEDSNIRNALLGFDQGADGVIDKRDFARGLVKMERGEIYLSPQIFNHIKSLNPSFEIIQNAFNTLDPNNDNQISAQEFVDNFNKAISVNGQANFERLAILSDVIDVFYPAASSLKAFKDAVDVDRNDQLTTQELINGLLKLRRGEITNPGADIVNAVTSTNPESPKIISLISQIDADNDGRVSNVELANNLLKIRKNEFPSEDLGLVQAVLNSNDKYNDIQSLVNLFDRNQDGGIADLELFDALIKLKSNSYNGFVDNAVVTLLKSKNPNAAAIEGVLNNFDANNDGKTNLTELINGFLKINGRQMPEPPAEILNTLIDANGVPYQSSTLSNVRTFVASVDKDINGVISDSEVISMMMNQRNTTDNISYNQELMDVVLANNTNSANITSLMDRIDPNKNGILTDTEFINAVVANKKGQFAPTNQAWVSQILATNPRATELQNLYNSIDADGNGTISDSEVIESLIKYKDDNLQNPFKTAGSLNTDDMQILEGLLGTNSNYQNLQNQWNSLASTYQGDLHEMMNRLVEIRSGTSVSPADNLLITAMSTRLNQWVTQRPEVYKQKVSSLFAEINQDAVIVDTGNNSNEEQLLNTISSNRSLSTTKTQEITAKQTELTQLQADLQDPAKINTVVQETNAKGELVNKTVVNQEEVNRINTAIQATQAQIAAAQAAVTQAQSAAQAATESAYASLQISSTTRTLMQRVMEQAEAVKTAHTTNSPSYYLKMDDLLDSYAELTQILSPNKENLLSVLFFDEFKAKLNSLPRSGA
jgi:Ca2+-binding EF-hand superfamily protein